MVGGASGAGSAGVGTASPSATAARGAATAAAASGLALGAATMLLAAGACSWGGCFSPLREAEAGRGAADAGRAVARGTAFMAMSGTECEGVQGPGWGEAQGTISRPGRLSLIARGSIRCDVRVECGEQGPRWVVLRSQPALHAALHAPHENRVLSHLACLPSLGAVRKLLDLRN